MVAEPGQCAGHPSRWRHSFRVLCFYTLLVKWRRMKRQCNKALEAGRQNQSAIQQLVQAHRDALTARASEVESRSMVSSKDIVKLLPQPEPFAAASRDEELSKWRSWSWQLEQYVSEAKDPVSLPDMSEATKNRSTLLHALLTGLLHERGLQILKTVGSQNGFEAYRLINADLWLAAVCDATWSH